MKRRAFFFRIGAFSLINDAVFAGFLREFCDMEWTVVDVERDIVRSRPLLHARATAGAVLRYGARIASNRQPPRDFFPRLPVVIDAVRQWVRENVDPAETAFVFQTQSLFDARCEGIPHFLYTDHTYLANLRYANPKPLLPVPAAWRRMERELYAGTTCNFVSSGFAAESLRGDYAVPDSRVQVVDSGSNIAETGEAGSRRGNAVLFVGVDWERKGGPELLAAFREVKTAMPAAELWIVGCAPAIEDAGVKIFGRVPPERVAEFYRDADVFCLPSRMDPSASVLAEAALRGLPVVATPVGGNLERVEDGVTGYLCEPMQLALRLLALLRDPELRRSFGEAGRRLAQERFTWEAVCRRMAQRMRKEIDS